MVKNSMKLKILFSVDLIEFLNASQREFMAEFATTFELIMMVRIKKFKHE